MGSKTLNTDNFLQKLVSLYVFVVLVATISALFPSSILRRNTANIYIISILSFPVLLSIIYLVRWARYLGRHYRRNYLPSDDDNVLYLLKHSFLYATSSILFYMSVLGLLYPLSLWSFSGYLSTVHVRSPIQLMMTSRILTTQLFAPLPFGFLQSNIVIFSEIFPHSQILAFLLRLSKGHFRH